jgi:LuxR family transcriptional regulator, maltose regulon positive regulatory protein
MSGPLLATKLFIPPGGKNLVERPRLFEKLNQSLLPGNRLTIISAPAGFGKTTLISTWVAYLKSLEQQHPPLISWLSLDEEDNNPYNFWFYVIASLQSQQEGIGQQALNSLQISRPPDLKAALVSLVNDLTQIDIPLIFVLDDYHHIRNHEIHSSLSFFIEHVPAQFHGLVLSRTVPPLPLSLLRGRGCLQEVRISDLRFTLEETTFFFNQTMDLGLKSNDVEILSQRTEGWIVGLQMAALSLRDEIDRHDFVVAFGGDDRYIADYLFEEVLQRQPPEIQSFLLKTSFLDPLTAPLCDAVTGRKDSLSMLNFLEQENLFILPLDNRRAWFRYHHLFADLLQRRLIQMEGEQGLKVLQRCAVDWLAANNFHKLAVKHAIKSADFDLAAKLMIATSEHFIKENDFNSLLNLAQYFPEGFISQNMTLTCLLAHAANVTGHIEKANQFILNVEKRLGVTIDDFITHGDILNLSPVEKAGLIELGMISARLNIDTFNLARTFYLSENLLPYLKPERDNEPIAFNLPSNLRGSLLFTRGLAQKLHGDVALAVQTFAESTEEGRRTKNLHIEVLSLSHQGDALALQGRLHEAQKTFLQVLSQSKQNSQLTPFFGIAEAGLGNLAYEWNEVEKAEEYFQAAIEKGMWWHNWENLLPGYSGMARIHANRGDWQLAFEAVDSLVENTIESWGIVQSCAGSLRALLNLRSGNSSEAERWAEAYEPERPCDYMVAWEVDALVGCRVLIQIGQTERASSLVEQITVDASSSGRNAHVLEALCIKAILLHKLHQDYEALATLSSALNMAKTEGYIRSFVDEGEQMADLLQKAVKEKIFPEYSSRILAAFPEPLRTTFPVANDQKHRPALAESLSEREFEVIHLVAEGLTNKEIAHKLFISLRTVKYHTTSIYSKLGVTGRTQAIHKARELGLL